MTIQVVNLHKTTADWNLGRSSSLGNPFKVEGDNLDLVCDVFAEYLFHILLHKESIPADVAVDISLRYHLRISTAYKNPSREEILTLLAEVYGVAKTEDVTIGCYCKPKRCHLDTVKQFLDDRIHRSMVLS